MPNAAGVIAWRSTSVVSDAKTCELVNKYGLHQLPIMDVFYFIRELEAEVIKQYEARKNQG